MHIKLLDFYIFKNLWILSKAFWIAPNNYSLIYLQIIYLHTTIKIVYHYKTCQKGKFIILDMTNYK